MVEPVPRPVGGGTLGVPCEGCERPCVCFACACLVPVPVLVPVPAGVRELEPVPLPDCAGVAAPDPAGALSPSNPSVRTERKGVCCISDGCCSMSAGEVVVECSLDALDAAGAGGFAREDKRCRWSVRPPLMS